MSESASKLAIPERYLKIQHLSGFLGELRAGYAHKLGLYIYRKFFARAAFALLIVCLYFEPLTRYKVSKLTTLKKIQHIWRYGRASAGTTASCYTFLKGPVELMFSSN